MITVTSLQSLMKQHQFVHTLVECPGCNNESAITDPDSGFGHRNQAVLHIGTGTELEPRPPTPGKWRDLPFFYKLFLKTRTYEVFEFAVHTCSC